MKREKSGYTKISQMTWKYASFSQTARKSPLNIRSHYSLKCLVCGVSPSPKKAFRAKHFYFFCHLFAANPEWGKDIVGSVLGHERL
ncbi:hypothetical protein CEXT_28381 [Caerostris extrusa]|uniref:Uncharacterized protein n=1 Tax=Caerostris extrusa TaxID=172846 RepID=A0AAV4TFU0_CAEEX|nr:hypothetical protein CEXT_28381 [Caerostris extrusa]